MLSTFGVRNDHLPHIHHPHFLFHTWSLTAFGAPSLCVLPLLLELHWFPSHRLRSASYMESEELTMEKHNSPSIAYEVVTGATYPISIVFLPLDVSL